MEILKKETKNDNLDAEKSLTARVKNGCGRPERAGAAMEVAGARAIFRTHADL